MKITGHISSMQEYSKSEEKGPKLINKLLPSIRYQHRREEGCEERFCHALDGKIEPNESSTLVMDEGSVVGLQGWLVRYREAVPGEKSR